MYRPVTPNQSHDDKVALRGASLAFQKALLKPMPNSAAELQNPDNRALIAATSASRDASRDVSRDQSRDHSLSRPPTRAKASQPISRQTTSSSIPEQQALQQNNGSHYLGFPGKHAIADPRSPSFIAAALAVSRSGTPSPHHTAQSHPYVQQTSRRPRNGSTGGYSATSSVTSLDLATDATSIASTNALISLFEKKDDDTDPVKKPIMVSDSWQSLGVKPRLRPMTPPRTMSPIAKYDVSPSRQAGSLAWGRAASASPPASVKEAAHGGAGQPPNAAIKSKNRPPTPPPARTRNEVDVAVQSQALQPRGKPRASTPPPRSINRTETVILSPRPRRTASQKILPDEAEELAPAGKDRRRPAIKPKPQRPIPVDNTSEAAMPVDGILQGSTVTQLRRSFSTTSNDTFVSALSVPPDSPRRGRSRTPTPDLVRPVRPSSAQTVSTSSPGGRPPVPAPRCTDSTLSLDSLTSAIVAGSLASSRVTPTTVVNPPPPPARRRTPHMRQTLRQPPNKSDDEGSRAQSRHRKPLGKLSHGNKHSHHEGARKRWREEITARERKRYEGVWASNRGLFLESSQHEDAGDLVVNLVVRDMWSRSRLPLDELAEVWDLVDSRKAGVLDRAEFVVGMWLIDQRLRGRKIPRKVSDSVWGSAKGVQIPEPKRKDKK
ncbi:hypothetical protein F4779DRAFT_597852 [Xylariaceae sp. FL0662B]|nr:hypothetical protein F4779DRAFT_597852 [Xylariaceae sp. FL0662B]